MICGTLALSAQAAQAQGYWRLRVGWGPRGYARPYYPVYAPAPAPVVYSAAPAVVAVAPAPVAYRAAYGCDPYLGNCAVAQSAYPTQLGLGFQALGMHWNDADQGGGAVHLRIRPSPFFTWELAGGMLGGTSDSGLTRRDAPVTTGMYLYPWGGFLAPYFVGVAGVNFAQQSWRDQHEDATQLVAALGGGLEVRVSRHLALAGDLRYQWRFRVDQPSASSPVAMETGAPLVLGDERGPAFTLSATFYF